MITRLLLLGLLAVSAVSAADAPRRKVLFFTKSSGYEHDVISYRKGQPSFAEKQLLPSIWRSSTRSCSTPPGTSAPRAPTSSPR
jgi:hypothetical protein